ncbi:MAG: inorganic phosphate transporter [Thermodesulfobacteriota bacterium]
MTFESALLVLSIAAGAYMAWNIGANDVANSMASAVGAKAITLRQAIVISSILTFIGATFVGSNVTQTIRNGIVDCGPVADPNVVVIGILSALLAASLWVCLATARNLPVSTTHSVVGAMIGFGLVVGGPSSVKWMKLVNIVLAWVLSPILSATAAFFLFRFIDRRVLAKMDSAAGAVSTTPILVAVAMLVTMLSFFVKTPLSDKLGLHGPLMFAVPVSLSVMAFAISRPLLSKVLAGKEIAGGEEIFRYLQVGTSCLVALANGANDVANAMGPLSAIYFIQSTGCVAEHVPVPTWMLAFGGLMICFGIATWGYRVIETVGSRITTLTNTRGFSVDFSAASVVLIASILGLPVSVTHAAVGAYVGIGLARGLQALDLRTIGTIIVYWVITVPVAAATAAVLYIILAAVFIGR